MEKEVIINFKHQQDFKMNEDYDKDLSLSKLSPGVLSGWMLDAKVEE